MTNSPVLSLCIPTNGVIEWVFPVLDSIYSQGVNEEDYEVIVMDNGNNNEFCEMMTAYVKDYHNLIYKKTEAYEFLSEIEAYKAAKGLFIKFINHRTKLKEGALKYFIDFIKKNEKDRPVVYFSNGILSRNIDVCTMNSFDEFVRRLSYWSSWSTGMAFWKDDFEAITNLDSCNYLFPHTAILFARRDANKYIVDNTELLDEIPTGEIPKGRYNLFNAFAVEYPAIITDLYREKSISIETLLIVKKENLQFLSTLYFDYIIRKNPCSYDLSKSNESINVFYSKAMVYKKIVKLIIKKIFML